MGSLERRLRVLEAWSRPGACLECECARLNEGPAAATGPKQQPCSHPRGGTLVDALRGLNNAPSELD
jgi:hypothetical protein